WFMAAGGLLISSPIIIHLINRMRYKRIRWAAMEFLLKSQKRNRRRLIIEQLILLLLRILLVLLAALLLARYLYSGVQDQGGGNRRGRRFCTTSAISAKISGPVAPRASAR